MNKERRTRLAAASRNLEIALRIINDACEEEQESFDNLPEGIQDSDRGAQMEENVGLLEEAADAIDTALESLGQIV